jgi:ABC-type siderophore export system fused ATPase/permease subunit
MADLMVKAVISHGQIRPLEPLPADWHEGQPLSVDRMEENEMTVETINRDFILLDQLCTTNDSKNEQLLDNALQQAKLQAKEQVRRQMGLS